MEMERVPEAGYRIVGLPVRGFNRAQPWKNISVLIDLWKSMRMAKRIIRDFKPDVAVGVGGYASGAAMKMAARMGIPVLLQEQNGFAGVTNKLLRNDAARICVAYDNMERFFPKEKIIFTGNPVRQDLTCGDKERAVSFFNREFGVRFDTETPTLLIIGGSLGARTINNSIASSLPQLAESGMQVIWQTGKAYYDKCRAALDGVQGAENIVCTAFLKNMPDCYALADLVISRAGASSISEICLLGKAAILVPSPNVAEDHQTHNAMALVNRQAAVLVRDADAEKSLVLHALTLINDEERLALLRKNVYPLGRPDSADRIAEEVIKLISTKQEKKR